jgi:hypothetical protein
MMTRHAWLDERACALVETLRNAGALCDPYYTCRMTVAEFEVEWDGRDLPRALKCAMNKRTFRREFMNGADGAGNANADDSARDIVDVFNVDPMDVPVLCDRIRKLRRFREQAIEQAAIAMFCDGPLKNVSGSVDKVLFESMLVVGDTVYPYNYAKTSVSAQQITSIERDDDDDLRIVCTDDMCYMRAYNFQWSEYILDKCEAYAHIMQEFTAMPRELRAIVAAFL